MTCSISADVPSLHREWTCLSHTRIRQLVSICFTVCVLNLHLFTSPFMQLNKDGSGAQLLKSAVVKTPLSVYEATAGRELYRPVQTSPISNFFLAGCFTKQKYLASMEGATFSGKLAARALADAAMADTVRCLNAQATLRQGRLTCGLPCPDT